MVFRDMTFCESRDCARWGKDCLRGYTQEVHQAAIRWWGDENYPIALMIGRPYCYEGESIEREADKRESDTSGAPSV
jgi:hypothetical protein